jgi:hypothetical protein
VIPRSQIVKIKKFQIDIPQPLTASVEGGNLLCLPSLFYHEESQRRASALLAGVFYVEGVSRHVFNPNQLIWLMVIS